MTREYLPPGAGLHQHWIQMGVPPMMRGLPVFHWAWSQNTRLIPHYSLAAVLLVAHVGCGNRIAFCITGIGVALATVITVAMLGVHIA
jgi:hypothetical protein